MKRKAKVTQIERATHLWPDLKVELVAVRRGRHPAIIPLESPQSNSLGYVIHGDSIGMRYLKIDEKWYGCRSNGKWCGRESAGIQWELLDCTPELIWKYFVIEANRAIKKHLRGLANGK